MAGVYEIDMPTQLNILRRGVAGNMNETNPKHNKTQKTPSSNLCQSNEIATDHIAKINLRRKQCYGIPSK